MNATSDPRVAIGKSHDEVLEVNEDLLKISWFKISIHNHFAHFHDFFAEF